jgi:hypothetical protein
MDSPRGVPGELERAIPSQALNRGVLLLLPKVQDPPESVLCNMQHFKANLLADMMVCKLLDIQQQQGSDVQLGNNSVALKVKQQAQPGGQHYDQQQQQWPVGQQQQQQQQQQQGGAAAAGVLEESSFE